MGIVGVLNFPIIDILREVENIQLNTCAAPECNAWSWLQGGVTDVLGASVEISNMLQSPQQQPTTQLQFGKKENHRDCSHYPPHFIED